MWTWIALGIAAVVALLLVVVALQPAEFTIERSIAIAAPPDVVYPHIASLRAMSEWSPWTKMDDQMKVEYAGPESGVGATQSWQGPKMGQGRLSVVGVKPNDEVEMKLEMLAPMAATNRVVFPLAPADRGTRVTWHMDGRNGFMGKAFSLISSMDKMVGEPFEQGLAALKVTAERDAARLANAG